MHEEQCCGHSGRTRRGLLTLPAQVGALAVIGTAAGRTATIATYDAGVAASGAPKEAIAALIAGNQRYVASRLNVCSSDLPKVWQETESKQTPFAAILSCADSRVPVELVFDQGVGQVFVTRVAGNIATAEIIASLEYGVAVLGARAIMVLGHGNCGAVAATMARKAAPGQISSLYAFIRPAVDRSGGELEQAIRTNAVLQAQLLAQSSPVLADALAARKLAIVSAYYDVGTGKVTLLGG
jgi:carbonic anhydrase